MQLDHASLITFSSLTHTMVCFTRKYSCQPCQKHAAPHTTRWLLNTATKRPLQCMPCCWKQNYESSWLCRQLLSTPCTFHSYGDFVQQKTLRCLATSIEGRTQSLCTRTLRHLRCFLELAFDRHGFSTIFCDPCPLLWRHPIKRAGVVMT